MLLVTVSGNVKIYISISWYSFNPTSIKAQLLINPEWPRSEDEATLLAKALSSLWLDYGKTMRSVWLAASLCSRYLPCLFNNVDIALHKFNRVIGLDVVHSSAPSSSRISLYA